MRKTNRLYHKYKNKGLGKLKFLKKLTKPRYKKHFKRVLVGWAMLLLESRSWGRVCFRDPNGIRPAYFYKDDEIVVVASERPVIQTAFGVPINKIRGEGGLH